MGPGMFAGDEIAATIGLIELVGAGADLGEHVGDGDAVAFDRHDVEARLRRRVLRAPPERSLPVVLGLDVVLRLVFGDEVVGDAPGLVRVGVADAVDEVLVGRCCTVGLGGRVGDDVDLLLGEIARCHLVDQ